MKRPWNWLSFLAGAALAGAGVGVAWAVLHAQYAEQVAYENCVAQLNYADGFDSGDLDELDAILNALEACDF